MSARRRFAPWLGLALFVSLGGGCRLTEVTTAPAEDLLVAEAILRAGANRQILVLHRAISPELEVPGEPGARVVVRGQQGQEIVFSQSALANCVDGIAAPSEEGSDLKIDATCYVSPRLPAITPGSTYDLDILTQDGLRLRGRTTVPGTFAIRLPRPGPGAMLVCALPPATNLPLAWSVSEGTWSYIASMQINALEKPMAAQGISAPDRLQLTAVSVSERDTTMRVPADFGIFDLGTVNQEILKFLQNGFPAGVTVHLTLSAADRNYVNAVRGGAFNPSGNVRISSVVGDGVGVFGSMVAQILQIHVGVGLRLPSCLE